MYTARAADILYTPNISGVHANFLRPSILAAGLDPDNLPRHTQLDMKNETKAWKTVWSAGHGVGAIDDLPPVAVLAERLISEYRAAISAADDLAARVRQAADRRSKSQFRSGLPVAIICATRSIVASLPPSCSRASRSSRISASSEDGRVRSPSGPPLSTPANASAIPTSCRSSNVSASSGGRQGSRATTSLMTAGWPAG